jgi:hypothetical protein
VLGRLQAAEPAAYDHDAMHGWGLWGTRARFALAISPVLRLVAWQHARDRREAAGPA